jgi:MazG family protein
VKYTFQDLVSIMERLRAKDGCPWDREQTTESLLPYLVEESAEYIDAALVADKPHMAEELGDVLLQVVFHAQIAKEQGDFDIEAVVSGICEKMVRRHPHVFGSEQIQTSGAVLKKWEEIKATEKGHNEIQSQMDKVPKSMPAIARAQELQRRAAKVGFDWKDTAPVAAKVREEFEEFAQEPEGSPEAEAEFGDILFALVNLARHKGINAELAMKRANAKFDRRFRAVEKLAGPDIRLKTLEELDAYWTRVKEAEK